MLTRVLLALVLICGTAAAGLAEETKVLALGITDHAPTQEELERGEALPQPKFNTPAVAYALTSDLKKGDVVELNFNNEGKSLMHNTATIAGDAATNLLLAGKRGVPAGGWPEGSYTASVKVTRDSKTVIEQQSEPMPFD